MTLKNSIIKLAAIAIVTFGLVDVGQADVILTPEEYELGQLINQYRADNGKAEIPVTVSLTNVAQLHVNDLHVYEPDSHPGCNMHSWSANGNWSPVCYTPDHANAEGMWNKPREITNNLYTGNGYEIAYGNSNGATAIDAFLAWQQSPPHNDVLLNNGIWSNGSLNPWPAMGIGILEDHAVVWFGETVDPQGNASTAPEPSAGLLLLVGLVSVLSRRKKEFSQHHGTRN